MRHEDGRLVAEDAAHAVLEDVVRRVVVDRRQRVVEQHEVAAVVRRARDVEALALAARKVDAAQAGLGGGGLGGLFLGVRWDCFFLKCRRAALRSSYKNSPPGALRE